MASSSFPPVPAKHSNTSSEAEETQWPGAEGGVKSPKSFPARVLYGLFFLSGFPALLYQIVWQRSLFAIYGVNIESVTVVVSAFMLGLGVGSLVGGLVSERPGVPLLALFGVAELGIACFGAVSLRIFHGVALFTAGGSPLKTGVVTFFLLLIPTIFMGGTLPLLVAYLVQVSGNVGRSVGVLYSVNTLGSASACFVAAFFTMHYLGQSGSVNLAAAINVLVGASVLYMYWSTRNTSMEKRRTSTASGAGYLPPTEVHLFPLAIALLVSGLAGFVALGYEILWYRVYSFVSGGQARTFPLLLGFYLTGIALGSLLTRVFCRQLGKESLGRHLRLLAGFVLLANLCGYLVIPIAGRVATLHGLSFSSYFYSLPFVTLATVMLGAIFPLVSHAAVKPASTAGAHLGFLYLSNIMGSTLGSFLVGYVLMDVWTTKGIAVFIAALGIALASAIFLCSGIGAGRAAIGVAAAVALIGIVILFSGPLVEATYQRLQEKAEYQPSFAFDHIVETKSGVITVTKDATVYGGGIYDGKFNTNIEHDVNGLYRPYSMSLWHSAPREVLMVGLASGSWAQVVANHPQVEKMTVVEINPGYLRLIPQYPAVASLLTNSKVNIVIDDGRRWLVSNPAASFDVIVMNTTYNWRAQITDLLSVEFLQLARKHLKPGGVLFYNTTSSEEVQRTGASVFPYALMVGNCLAVSDSPIAMDWERWKAVLKQYRIDGQLVFDFDQPDSRKKFEELTSIPVNQPERFDSVQDADLIRARTKGARTITDDNMGTEWPASQFLR